MQAFKLLESPLARLRVSNNSPIREGCQVLHTQIYAHHRAGVGRNALLLLDLNRDVPMPCLLRDSRGENPHAGCIRGRQISVLFKPQPPQPGQLNGFRKYGYRAGEPEATQSLLLRFGSGITDCPRQLALLLERTATEEVGKGVV